MDYWNECITEAFDDLKIKATKDQIDGVASWIEGANENYGLATGLDVASANFKSDEGLELEELKKSIEKDRVYIASTNPCANCHTVGIIKDYWGRDVICEHCNGDGRIKPY
jgi:DnaJ-class molecular chaperone